MGGPAVPFHAPPDDTAGALVGDWTEAASEVAPLHLSVARQGSGLLVRLDDQWAAARVVIGYGRVLAAFAGSSMGGSWQLFPLGDGTLLAWDPLGSFRLFSR